METDCESKRVRDSISNLRQGKKMRITPHLVEVLKIIQRGAGHFSVSDVYGEAKKTIPSLSLNTVYSIIKRLQRMGEIQEVATLNKEASYCPSSRLHHHVTCSRCKKVEDIETSFFNIKDLNRTINSGFEIKSYSILFSGYCRTCVKDGLRG